MYNTVTPKRTVDKQLELQCLEHRNSLKVGNSLYPGDKINHSLTTIYLTRRSF